LVSFIQDGYTIEALQTATGKLPWSEQKRYLLRLLKQVKRKGLDHPNQTVEEWIEAQEEKRARGHLPVHYNRTMGRGGKGKGGGGKNQGWVDHYKNQSWHDISSGGGGGYHGGGGKGARGTVQLHIHNDGSEIGSTKSPRNEDDTKTKLEKMQKEIADNKKNEKKRIDKEVKKLIKKKKKKDKDSDDSSDSDSSSNSGSSDSSISSLSSAGTSSLKGKKGKKKLKSLAKKISKKREKRRLKSEKKAQKKLDDAAAKLEKKSEEAKMEKNRADREYAQQESFISRMEKLTNLASGVHHVGLHGVGQGHSSAVTPPPKGKGVKKDKDDLDQCALVGDGDDDSPPPANCMDAGTGRKRGRVLTSVAILAESIDDKKHKKKVESVETLTEATDYIDNNFEREGMMLILLSLIDRAGDTITGKNRLNRETIIEKITSYATKLQAGQG